MERGLFPSFANHLKSGNMKQRLDTYDRIPPAMADYLSQYGWHFSKKMCLWAVSRMKMENKSTGKEEKLEPISKEQVEELLKSTV